MKVREWPAGHRLFSEGGFHLCFDEPQRGEKVPAILCRIEGDVLTILNVEVFDSDAAALAWFAQQRKRLGH